MVYKHLNLMGLLEGDKITITVVRKNQCEPFWHRETVSNNDESFVHVHINVWEFEQPDRGENNG